MTARNDDGDGLSLGLSTRNDAWRNRVDWEATLPTKEELVPLNQRLITPMLAAAFSIKESMYNVTEQDVERAAQATLNNILQHPRLTTRPEIVPPSLNHPQFQSLHTGASRAAAPSNHPPPADASPFANVPSRPSHDQEHPERGRDERSRQDHFDPADRFVDDDRASQGDRAPALHRAPPGDRAPVSRAEQERQEQQREHLHGRQQQQREQQRDQEREQGYQRQESERERQQQERQQRQQEQREQFSASAGAEAMRGEGDKRAAAALFPGYQGAPRDGEPRRADFDGRRFYNEADRKLSNEDGQDRSQARLPYNDGRLGNTNASPHQSVPNDPDRSNARFGTGGLRGATADVDARFGGWRHDGGGSEAGSDGGSGGAGRGSLGEGLRRPGDGTDNAQKGRNGGNNPRNLTAPVRRVSENGPEFSGDGGQGRREESEGVRERGRERGWERERKRESQRERERGSEEEDDERRERDWQRERGGERSREVERRRQHQREGGGGSQRDGGGGMSRGGVSDSVGNGKGLSMDEGEGRNGSLRSGNAKERMQEQRQQEEQQEGGGKRARKGKESSPEPDEDSGNQEGNSSDGQPRTLKRPRLVWTPQLHKRFVDAVSHLGIKNAVPKTIMQLMNVEGLTRENVASHLQKYRLYLKRMQVRCREMERYGMR
ncbi:unnamed protein product [Closterium sp. Yama58-4]|nr:unnamed protein product [Closterium sp. Yama58-4]